MFLFVFELSRAHPGGRNGGSVGPLQSLPVVPASDCGDTVCNMFACMLFTLYVNLSSFVNGVKKRVRRHSLMFLQRYMA